MNAITELRRSLRRAHLKSIELTVYDIENYLFKTEGPHNMEVVGILLDQIRQDVMNSHAVDLDEAEAEKFGGAK